MLVPLAQGKPLVASVVFTAISLTDSISYNSVRKFNYALSAAADYCSVITRLQEVLLLDEKKSFPPSLELKPPQRILLTSFTSSWSVKELSDSD